MMDTFDPNLVARGYAIFGHGIAENSERYKWMTEQEQRRIENEINRSKALIYPVGRR